MRHIALARKAGLAALTIGLTMAAHAGAQNVTPRAPGAAAQDRDVQVDAVRRISQLIGTEVRGRSGQDAIADVNDVVMDTQGEIRYLLIGRGGVVGIGQDLIAVPFRAANFTRGDDGGWRVQLGVTEEQLEGAPTIDADEINTLVDPARAEQLDAYFTTDDDTAIDNDRQPRGGVAQIVRASDFIGAEVKGLDGDANDRESIADIEDVLLDSEYRAIYAVLGRGGVADLGETLIPIPFGALTTQVNPAEETVECSLPMTRDQIEDAPTLDGEWNKMLNASFVEGVNQFFSTAGVTPNAPAPRR